MKSIYSLPALFVRVTIYIMQQHIITDVTSIKIKAKTTINQIKTSTFANSNYLFKITDIQQNG